MNEDTFDARVKAIAATVGAVLAALSHALNWSPTVISAHLIDVIASAVCACAAVYYAVKKPASPAA